MTETIESQNNKTLRLISSLQTTKGRKKTGNIIIEGFRMVNDAITNGVKITHLIVCDSVKNTEKVYELISNNNTFRVYSTTKKLFSEISDTVNSQGVIAVAKRPITKLHSPHNGRILVLNNIQDPGNLGTLIRTADAFGIGKILVTKGSCDIYNPKVLRSTMSSIFNIPIVDGVTSNEVVEYLNSNKIKIATTLLNDNSKLLPKVLATGNWALVLGNEGHGVEQLWKDNADLAIKIPMFGKAESLNVAVAGGIIMYHFSCLS